MTDRSPADTPGDSHWSLMIEQCTGRPKAQARKQRPAAVARGPHAAVPLLQGPPCEREVLRALLPSVERHLLDRRVDLLSQRDLGRYLALEWLEWHGGTLRLTQVGRNVCDQARGFSSALAASEA